MINSYKIKFWSCKHRHLPQESSSHNANLVMKPNLYKRVKESGVIPVYRKQVSTVLWQKRPTRLPGSAPDNQSRWKKCLWWPEDHGHDKLTSISFVECMEYGVNKYDEFKNKEERSKLTWIALADTYIQSTTYWKEVRISPPQRAVKCEGLPNSIFNSIMVCLLACYYVCSCQFEYIHLLVYVCQICTPFQDRSSAPKSCLVSPNGPGEIAK